MKSAFVVISLLTTCWTVSVGAAPNACLKAVGELKQQESLARAKAVEDACGKLIQPTCESWVDAIDGLSGSDARLVLTGCALRTAYASNLAVGNGKASHRCEEAVTHLYTAFTDIAAESAGICLSENEAFCAKASSDLEKTKCRAKAAHAGYLEAKSAQGLKLSPELDKKAKAMADKEVENFVNDFFEKK